MQLRPFFSLSAHSVFKLPYAAFSNYPMQHAAFSNYPTQHVAFSNYPMQHAAFSKIMQYMTAGSIPIGNHDIEPPEYNVPVITFSGT